MENNFLTTITAPTLGSATFATDLREVFRNIDDNFKKIVSAPYLEGQEGNSVEAYDMPIVENGELTEFGAAMVREILSDPSIETIQDIIDNPERYSSVGPAQHNIYDYLFSHPTMKVLRTMDPDTGEVDRWICSAEYYCFIDLRVEDLGNCGYPSTQTTFVDYSCLVFAEWNGTEWVFTKGNMMPTLYYSADQGCFCWKVNGMETGIRAQGVKGDDGRPPKAAVVKGFGSYADIGGGVVRIVATEYSVFETTVVDGVVTVEASWGDIQNSGLLDGDLVVCLFNIADPTYPEAVYQDMIVANIKKTGDGINAIYSITAPNSNRFSSLWNSYIMFYGFRGIDYKSTDKAKTKAVFVPAATPGVTHAMFQDDSGVEYTSTGGVWTSTDNLGEDNLVFKRVRETRLLGNGSIGTVNLMTNPDPFVEGQAKAKFLGYDLEVEGTAKANVSGNNILLGVPVGSVVSWINMDTVPEGWYPTGEVTEFVPPVFGLRYVDIENDDYDVAVVCTTEDNVIIQKLEITGIGDENELSARDKRFLPIFCLLTGYEMGSPIVVETEQYDFSRFLEDEKFNWTMFDLYATEDGVKFYLTKQV